MGVSQDNQLDALLQCTEVQKKVSEIVRKRVEDVIQGIIERCMPPLDVGKLIL